MKKKYSLLPYIKENVYGFDGSSQHIGWEISKFNIPSKWKTTEGESVVVAVIDTGCDLNHQDLAENLLDGINFIDRNKSPQDDNGHGTHVSGTIAAINNSRGIVGVAPKAKILPIKALDKNGSGGIRPIIDGIIWAADAGVDFITMSLGSPNRSIDLEQAIDYADRAGVVVFCAAGNSGENAEIMYPARYSKTISIGAVDENLNRTDFTCSGDELDFLAPGHNILGCVPSNGYAIMSGTSMSNPFAVGCAALLCSVHKQKNRKLTQQEYIDIFSKHSVSLKDPRYSGKKKYEGYGVIYPVL